jgi:hypothetical protein
MIDGLAKLPAIASFSFRSRGDRCHYTHQVIIAGGTEVATESGQTVSLFGTRFAFSLIRGII